MLSRVITVSPGIRKFNIILTRESAYWWGWFACVEMLVKYALVVLGLVLAGLAFVPSPRDAHTRELSDRASIVISGQARVIDGDTIQIGATRIRLEGIDAPEAGQVCPARTAHNTANPLKTPNPQWQAGKIASATLQRIVRGRDVICRATGHGRFGRLLGRCTTGREDIGAMMVRNGLAWAFVKYSRAFVHEERAARAAGRGIWAASCEPAWHYRRHRRDTVAASAPHTRAPLGCAIKGNITRKGRRIYHMPRSSWYARTRVDTNKGERWFCNERQALDAGWRPI